MANAIMPRPAQEPPGPHGYDHPLVPDRRPAGPRRPGRGAAACPARPAPGLRGDAAGGPAGRRRARGRLDTGRARPPHPAFLRPWPPFRRRRRPPLRRRAAGGRRRGARHHRGAVLRPAGPVAGTFHRRGARRALAYPAPAPGDPGRPGDLAGPAARNRLEGGPWLRHARPVRAGVDFLNTHHLEPSLNRKSPLSVALCALATTPALAAAQEITARPATADACLAISSNAQRLACYDAALG